MDALGFLLDFVVYLVVTTGAAAAVISHVDQKAAAPGASPWRIRAPKFAAAAGPLLFASAFAAGLAGVFWPLAALVIASTAAPWVALALIVTEWFRRRGEDRSAGVPRPVHPDYR